MIGEQIVSHDQALLRALREVGWEVVHGRLVNMRSGRRWEHRRVIVPIAESAGAVARDTGEICRNSSDLATDKGTLSADSQRGTERPQHNLTVTGVIDPIADGLVVNAQLPGDLPITPDTKVAMDGFSPQRYFVAPFSWLQRVLELAALAFVPLRASSREADFDLPFSRPAVRAGGSFHALILARLLQV